MITKCKVCGKTTRACGFGAYCRKCVGKKPAKVSLVDAQIERMMPTVMAEMLERDEMTEHERLRAEESFAILRRHREEAGGR